MKTIYFIFISFLFSMNAFALTTIPPGQFVIAGIPVNCGTAPTFLYFPNDPPLGDLAKANTSGIHINWGFFHQMPAIVQFFTYAHECGHINQLLSNSPINEDQADYFAVDLAKRQNILDMNGVQTVCSFIWSSPGDWTHKPGPVRCNNMFIYYQSIH